jgi:hypothetical protein
MNLTHVFETTVDGRKAYLQVVTKDISRFKSTYLKNLCQTKGVYPTGKEFVAETKIPENNYQWSSKPPDDMKSLNDEKFEGLCRAYLSLQEQVNKVSKELKEILKNEPDNIKISALFGAFDTFKISTSLSYSELYNAAKQMLIKNKPHQEILNELKEKETDMKSPHKGSAKTFEVFTTDVKEEKVSKIYKED